MEKLFKRLVEAGVKRYFCFTLVGNPVTFRGGPAAVSEDERRIEPLCCRCINEAAWEGTASRVNHEPEYLHEKLDITSLRDGKSLG